MKRFFTADTHFGSERTLELSKRPFGSVAEMDAAMISNWNSVVSEYDIVYHLGDWGDMNPELLNGYINLVTGNYDDDLDFSLFNDSYSTRYIDLDDDIIGLIHDPAKRRGLRFMLFGHIHKLAMVKKNALNVGMDCHNFTPISEEDVLFYKNAIQNHYDSSVFCK